MNHLPPSAPLQKSSISTLFIRGGGLFFVFLVLVLYLYLIQRAYDGLPKESWLRPFFFALTIMGAGVTWDVSKYVAFLKIERLKGFLYESSFALALIILYAFLALLTVALTKELAGPFTVATPFTAIGALTSCGLAVWRGSRAIEYATNP